MARLVLLVSCQDNEATMGLQHTVEDVADQFNTPGRGSVFGTNQNKVEPIIGGLPTSNVS